MIARKVVFGAGAGFNWWTTADAAAGRTRDGGGVIVIRGDDLNFKGNETFLRFSISVYF